MALVVAMARGGMADSPRTMFGHYDAAARRRVVGIVIVGVIVIRIVVPDAADEDAPEAMAVSEPTAVEAAMTAKSAVSTMSTADFDRGIAGAGAGRDCRSRTGRR